MGKGLLELAIHVPRETLGIKNQFKTSKKGFWDWKRCVSLCILRAIFQKTRVGGVMRIVPYAFFG